MPRRFSGQTHQNEHFSRAFVFFDGFRHGFTHFQNNDAFSRLLSHFHFSNDRKWTTRLEFRKYEK